MIAYLQLVVAPHSPVTLVTFIHNYRQQERGCAHNQQIPP